MFARCGPSKAASAGHVGLAGRVPVISPQAFRRRNHESSVPSSKVSELQWRESIAMTDEQLQQQLDLQSPADVLRRVFLGSQSKIRSRDISHRISAMQRRAGRTRQERERWNAEAGDGAQPYRTRRIRIGQELAEAQSSEAATAMTVTMDLLRFQVKACNSPEDLLHVVTATSKSANRLAMVLLGSDTLQHIMYNKVKDLSESWEDYDPARTIGLANILYTRFKSAGVQLSYPWISLALQSSISTLETDAMRFWLSIYSQHILRDRQHSSQGQNITDLLQSIKEAIKLRRHSFAHDDYKWSRKAKALLTLLSGNRDSSAIQMVEQDHRLSTYLDRKNTAQCKIYLELLSRLAPVADSSLLQSEYSKLPQAVQSKMSINVVHDLLRVGDAAAAWSLLATIDSKLCPSADDIIWKELFERASDIPARLLDSPQNHDLRKTVEDAFSRILEQYVHRLERALGVVWMPSDDEDQEQGGHHHIHRRDGLLQRGFQELAATPPIKVSDADRAIEAMVGRDDSWVDDVR